METRPVNRQASLDRAIRHADTAMAAAARMLSACPDALNDDAEFCLTATNDTYNALIDAGATPPGGRTKDRAFGLDSLATLDSPEARGLLAGLSALLPLAEAVDARRGYTVAEGTPLLPGESHGTDLAEEISTLTLRLSTEIHGPQTGRE
jgi:hypothetical protein